MSVIHLMRRAAEAGDPRAIEGLKILQEMAEEAAVGAVEDRIEAAVMAGVKPVMDAQQALSDNLRAVGELLFIGTPPATAPAESEQAPTTAPPAEPDSMEALRERIHSDGQPPPEPTPEPEPADEATTEEANAAAAAASAGLPPDVDNPDADRAADEDLPPVPGAPSEVELPPDESGNEDDGLVPGPEDPANDDR